MGAIYLLLTGSLLYVAMCVIGGHRWILHDYRNQHPQYYLAGTSFIYNQRQSVAVLFGYLGCIQLAVRALQIYIHRRRDLLQTS